VTLRRDDERRGRSDGEQRIPSLAEVRRLHQELQESGGQVTVGYQRVLLGEFNGELDGLVAAYDRTVQAIEREITQHTDHIEEATELVERARAGRTAAGAPLTEDELRPRNFEEERWRPSTLRNRREVERSRRVRQAQGALDAARDQLRKRKSERTAAVRRRGEDLTGLGGRARGLKELYERRMTVYADALARIHPDGKTLYPLLGAPDIALPSWIPDRTTRPRGLE
jgi:hypothetical protein